MLISKILITAAVLLGVVVADIQTKEGKPPRDLRRVNSPENTVASSPDSVKIELSPMTASSTGEVKQFAAGNKVRFGLKATNVSAEAVTIFDIDVYYQNRPRLTKGDKEVPYREEITKLVGLKDNDLETVRTPIGIPLEPNETKKIAILDLSDWYDPLEPGEYQLIDRHRFVFDGKWSSETSAVTFVVK